MMRINPTVAARRTCFVVIAIAFATFPIAVRADVVRKSFAVSPGGTLYLDTDLGSIEIRSGGSSVSVEVDRDSRTHDADRTRKLLEHFDLDFQSTGNDVRVTGRWDDPSYRRGSFLDLFDIFGDHDGNRLRVRYVVQVPSRFNLDLRTSGGDIHVGDLEGRVEARTSGGDLVVGRIDGPVRVHTSGGDVEIAGSVGKTEVRTSGGDISIDRAEGPLDARTSGGSIRVDQVSGDLYARTSGGNVKIGDVAGSIDASTSGGSIEAHISRQPQSACRLSTSGGNVTLVIAPGIGFDLDASAGGGRVTTDVPLTVQGTIRESKVQGKVNQGGPELILRTSGGGIRVRSE